MPKIWGFPLTLIVALTTVLRNTVLHREKLVFFSKNLVMPAGVTLTQYMTAAYETQTDRQTDRHVDAI